MQRYPSHIISADYLGVFAVSLTANTQTHPAGPRLPLASVRTCVPSGELAICNNTTTIHVPKASTHISEFQRSARSSPLHVRFPLDNHRIITSGGPASFMQASLDSPSASGLNAVWCCGGVMRVDDSPCA